MVAYTTIPIRSGRGTALAFAAAIALLSSSCGSLGPVKEAAAPAPVPADLGSMIASGDTEGLRAALKGTESLDKPDAALSFPLHYAVRSDSLDMVELILGLGAKPDPVDAEGRTPLALAVERGNAAIAKSLRAKGASAFSKDKSGVSVLDSALAKGFVAALFGDDTVNERDSQGRTALHIAADRLLIEGVMSLLSLKPDLSLRDDAGRTALDAAFLHPDRLESARIALELARRSAPSSFDDFSYFLRAVREGDYPRSRFADGATVLHEAVRYAHRGYLEFFLDEGVPVDLKNPRGRTALHEAVKSGRLDAAETLLRGGADPDARDEAGNTPLHATFPEGDAVASVRLLLSRKADPSLKNRDGDSPLHIQVSMGYPTETLALLLDSGAPIDSANAEGDTPLSLAVRKRRLEHIRFLVQRGANVFARNAVFETPLSLALKSDAATTRSLLSAARADLRDDSGNNAAHIAVRLGADPSVTDMLAQLGVDVSARNNEGETPLHIAARFNIRAQGEALIRNMADVFALNSRGETPVGTALEAMDKPLEWFFTDSVIASADAAGNNPLHYAAQAGLATGVLYLVRRGIDPNAVNAEGTSPLMAATRRDAVDPARTLLSVGAILSARDANGATVLHLAVVAGAAKCLKLFAENTKDPDPRDYSGRTPLHAAAARGDMAALSLLCERGANPNLPDDSGSMPLHGAASLPDPGPAAYLAERVADVDGRDDSGRTPLSVAVSSDNLETAAALVAAGASIHARAASGDSPLSLALGKNPGLLAALLSRRSAQSSDSEGRSVVRIILESKPLADYVASALAAGARPDDRDATGATPLLLAVRNAYWPVASLLVETGADVFARDARGATPIGTAIASGKTAVAALAAGPGARRTDALGNTMLHYAAISGDAAAVSALLEAGVPKAARNALGESASDAAMKKGFADLAASLSN